MEALTASSDADYDRFVKGMVHAFKQVLAMEVVPTEEESDEIQA